MITFEDFSRNLFFCFVFLFISKCIYLFLGGGFAMFRGFEFYAIILLMRINAGFKGLL